MNPHELEVITLGADDGSDDSFAILDRFKWRRKTYVFLAELEGESQLLYEDGKPVFLVFREDGEDYIELEDDEKQEIQKDMKENWKRLQRRLQELADHAS